MDVSQVDPRTSHGSNSSPVYRVYFWRSYDSDDSHHLPGSPPSLESDEYRITGARDIFQVLSWVNSESRGRAFQLFVEGDSRGGELVDLYQIAGIPDPDVS